MTYERPEPGRVGRHLSIARGQEIEMSARIR